MIRTWGGDERVRPDKEAGSVPSRLAGRTDKPGGSCPSCGRPLHAVFMDRPAYLKGTGKAPHWVLLPCSSCERDGRIAVLLRRAEEARKDRIDPLPAEPLLRKRFADKTFDTFIPYGTVLERGRQEHILGIVRDFADRFAMHRESGPWLLFTGNAGTGKGHLCAAVINRIVRQGYSALFTKAPRLLREIKDTFRSDAEQTQSAIVDRLGALDLLVIDEIGVQFGTETERMILYEILDLRYEAMLPVILTTNISSLATLERLLGERIIDRLYEGDSKILLFDWESHRRYRKRRGDGDRGDGGRDDNGDRTGTAAMGGGGVNGRGSGRAGDARG